MPFKCRKNLTLWIATIFIMVTSAFSVQASDYYPMQVGNQWVYTPSYGDGTRVDRILGTEELDGVLTYIWEARGISSRQLP